MDDEVTVTWNPSLTSDDNIPISEDLFAGMIKRMAEELDSKPEPSWPHRLVVQGKKLENGDMLIGADYEPIPEDEVNLDCDGC